jgi:hypothetical protein
MTRLDDLLRDPRAHGPAPDEAAWHAWSEQALARWQAEQARARRTEGRRILAAVLFHGSWVAALLWLFPLLTAGAGQVGDALGSAPTVLASLADPWLLLPLCAAIVLALTPPLRERLLAELD